MIDNLLSEIRQTDNLSSAIIGSVILDKASKCVTTKVYTDKQYSEGDNIFAKNILRKYIPNYFECEVEVSKLSPDCDMVKSKILECLKLNFQWISAAISLDDVVVRKNDQSFEYDILVPTPLYKENFCDEITSYLKKRFCGEFIGRCVKSKKTLSDLEIEEEHENIEYEMPVRFFNIDSPSKLDTENQELPQTAVYMADLNFTGEKVFVCGTILDIQEKKFMAKDGVTEKTMYNFTLSDTTANLRAAYFTRVKTIAKIKKLQVGDSIVCTGRSELYNGYIRYTATQIDYGNMPKNFIPEKRMSKPVPKYYSSIKPEPFIDKSQSDMFADNSVPDCLKGLSFVVFDLETTGLNSSNATGRMDKIIEIGAFKIIDGVICEQFTTFINPKRKLPADIITLTGITDDMLAEAPTYEKVMPDFFKFCDGSILVGHNAATFDFKFIDFYCANLGYMFERKLIDTYPLAQELLYLSNYKLNSVADKFGITFNHHRAIDDAYVTAKIFLELIKIKKSLPKL